MPPAGFEPGTPGNVRIWYAADLITIRRFMGSGPTGQRNVGSFFWFFSFFRLFVILRIIWRIDQWFKPIYQNYPVREAHFLAILSTQYRIVNFPLHRFPVIVLWNFVGRARMSLSEASRPPRVLVLNVYDWRRQIQFLMVFLIYRPL